MIRSSCKGCHECMECCPAEAIRFASDGIEIISAKCTSCGLCITVCRFGAILPTASF